MATCYLTVVPSYERRNDHSVPYYTNKLRRIPNEVQRQLTLHRGETVMEIHFVLIHGSGHGAWCWYKVVPVLKSMGHKVTALDLAASGINMTKQLRQVRSISDYSEPLMEFMAALPAEERVILVGHSMGGLSISIAMERFPQKIAAAVFVAAFMPGPNLPFPSILQQLSVNFQKKGGLSYFLDNHYTYEKGPDSPPTSLLFGPKYIAAKPYKCSPPQDMILGALLIRPAPLFNYPESLEGLSLTKENYGSVRRVCIICSEDGNLADAQRWMIENNPPEEVRVLDGADHMAMFSKASELCSCLIQVANSYI